MSTELSVHWGVERFFTAQPTMLTGTLVYGQALWPLPFSTMAAIHLANCFFSAAWIWSRSAALTGASDSQRTQ
ncbi:hypothetical protein SVIO_015690 [Streptomyces violaceusniger]|uniref:Uncharacterized protein n=1 Tax=Streptomyces violaceusniger TaxID=68280 RepID=A0A4D4KVQ2_STRVO|nr:hypothetical protein SVIO_015690 [Streptomyces violaceusniger]